MLAIWNGIAFCSHSNANTAPPAPPPHHHNHHHHHYHSRRLTRRITCSHLLLPTSSRPGRPPKRTQSVTSPENPHIMPHSVPGLMSPGMIPPTGTLWPSVQGSWRLLLRLWWFTLSHSYPWPPFCLTHTHTRTHSQTHMPSLPTSSLPAACPRNGSQSKVTHAPNHQTPTAHPFTKNRSSAQSPQTRSGENKLKWRSFLSD